MTSLKIDEIVSSVYRIMTDGKPYRIEDLLPLVQKDCGFTDEQMKEGSKGKGYPRVKKYIQYAVHRLYGAGLICKSSRGVNEIIPSQERLLKLGDKDLYDIVMSLYNSRKKKNTANSHMDTPDGDTEDVVEEYDWRTESLDFIYKKQYNESQARTRFMQALWEAELTKLDGVELDYKKILEEFEISKKKEYTLEIDIDVKWPIGMKYDKTVQGNRYTHLYMVDENGEKQELIMQSWVKALYLVFLLIGKEGILLEIFNDKEKRAPYQELYREIHEKMANHDSISDYTLDYAKVMSIRKCIKDSVALITQNKYLQMFCFEGLRLKPCCIEVATQEHKDYIIQKFDLEMPKLN